MLSGKVADGIIDEAQKMYQKEKGIKMAEQIRKVKNGTREEIWECFVSLYCKESFLYRRLNEVMRLAADGYNEKLWKSSIPTFGSFAYVLWRMGPVCNVKKMTVYRGLQLTKKQIKKYQKNCFNVKDSQSEQDDNSFDLDKPNFSQSSTESECEAYTSWKFSFPAFTSTSRCRYKAEKFGNSLLIIKISKFSGWDVSCYSKFNEEEHLLKPGILFLIESCTFDKTMNKWIIHLKCTL